MSTTNTPETPDSEIVLTLDSGRTYTKEQIFRETFFSRVPALLKKKLAGITDIKDSSDPRFVAALDEATKEAAEAEEMMLLELQDGRTKRARGARAAIMIEVYRGLRGEKVTRADVEYVQAEAEKGYPDRW